MKRLTVLILLIFPLLVSCPTGDYFSRLEGTNLLDSAAKDFTDWTITYSKTIPIGYDYLEFTEAAADAGTTAGLSAGAAIYRLELVNLVQNGDFEQALGANWTPVDDNDPVSTLELNIIPSAGESFEMYGNVLEYNIEDDPDDYIDFDFLSGLDFFESSGAYVLRFDLKSQTSGGITFEQRFREASGDAVDWSINIITANYLYKVPFDFDTVDGQFTYNFPDSFFTIGASQKSGTTQKGYIDNMRAGRTDVQSCIIIDVPWQDDTVSRWFLLSGFYRFSVMVKNDPTVSPATANRIPSESISLCLLSLKDGEIEESFSQSWSSSDTGADWSGWTKVWVDTNNSIQIDPPENSESANYNAIRLRITPTDISGGNNTYDIGSLLIAEPSLEFSSDGIFE